MCINAGGYSYEFVFKGQRVRESANTRNRELALSFERKPRTQMEESTGSVKRPKPPLFRNGVKIRLSGNAHWSDSYREINTLKLSHLLPVLAKCHDSITTATEIYRNGVHSD
jgi:hypothetical protein